MRVTCLDSKYNVSAFKHVFLFTYTFETHVFLFTYTFETHVFLFTYTFETHVFLFTYTFETHVYLFAYTFETHMFLFTYINKKDVFCYLLFYHILHTCLDSNNWIQWENCQPLCQRYLCLFLRKMHILKLQWRDT